MTKEAKEEMMEEGEGEEGIWEDVEEEYGVDEKKMSKEVR